MKLRLLTFLCIIGLAFSANAQSDLTIVLDLNDMTWDTVGPRGLLPEDQPLGHTGIIETCGESSSWIADATTWGSVWVEGFEDPEGDGTWELTFNIDDYYDAVLTDNGLTTADLDVVGMVFTETTQMREGKCGDNADIFICGLTDRTTDPSVVCGDGSEFTGLTASFGMGTGVETVSPETFQVQYFPNPFIEWANIYFVLDQVEDINLSIINTVGQTVKTFNPPASIGRNFVRWDGKNDFGSPVEPGIYFYRLQVGDKVTSGSLVKM